MELWIRSQDNKELIKVNDLYIFDNEINVNNGITIGKYKSEERAVEVINEIENMLKVRVITHGSYENMDLIVKSKMVSNMVVSNMVKVYDMPKE